MAFDGNGFPAYVPAAERRRRAARALAALARKGLAPSPVELAGRDLATTFWGKAWCDHLEALADLASRLPRGRAYVRCGAVVHLAVTRGEVRALVSGTELYEVRVGVQPLAPARWSAVRRACSGRIATVVELLAGRLSSAVMEVLCDREAGLFPASHELDLDCSCPDGARLCKHLAAVLYGVGARLDHAPELLFTLRGVDGAELVSAAAGSGALAGGTAPAELPADALAEIFGIELAPPSAPPPPLQRPAATPRKRAAARPARKGRRRAKRRSGAGRSRA